MNASVRPPKTSAELALGATFAAAKPILPGDGKVVAWREAAFERFAATGLPHRRVEAWKYTDLRALLREVKPLASPPDAATKMRAADARLILGDVKCRRLMLVDGTFAPDLSDLAKPEPGLTVRSMAEALACEDPLVVAHLSKLMPVRDVAVEVNTALMGDGVVIRVAAGTTLDRPLHLVYAAVAERPSAMFMRSLVIVEKGACVQLLESHEGTAVGDYQVNIALELVVGDDARVEHVKVTNEGPAALHIASLIASIGARAEFRDFTLTTGGSIVRNQQFLHFAGEGATADIRGATLLTRRQHADTTFIADHTAGDCRTRQLFKSVLDGEARGVFQGKIIVRPNAQKTDAKMRSQALLLSTGAEANSKPELEIFADDVQCGHGATAGALDDELRFYLMARGIPEKEAEGLLVRAFVGETLDVVAHEDLKNALLDAAATWLQARG